VLYHLSGNDVVTLVLRHALKKFRLRELSG